MYAWKILENVVPNFGIESQSDESTRPGRSCKIRTLIGPQKLRIMSESSFQFADPGLHMTVNKTK